MTPSMLHAIRFGAIRFCAVSLSVYTTVAFGERWLYQTLGFAGAYALWSMLFILLGALVLAPLAPHLSLIRFGAIFTVAFLGYAIGWIAAYFILRGSAGEWVGSFTGCLLMAFIFAKTFGRLSATQHLFVYLFTANSVGYFLGSILNSMVGGRPGMLLWGIAHGLFLGAGLGATLNEIKNVEKEDVKM